MLKHILLMTALVSVSMGCATGYHPSSYSGGYSHTQLAANVFEVSFSGNGYTGGGRARDYALLRCAEIALDSGYDYFIIMDADNWTTTSSYTSPSRSETRGSAYISGNQIHGSSTTRTYGGKTTTFVKPSTRNTIFLQNEESRNGVPAYDAILIRKNLSRKYGIEPWITDEMRADAEESAQRLEGLGPEGAQWAKLLRADPDGAQYEARKYGGLASLEKMLIEANVANE